MRIYDEPIRDPEVLSRARAMFDLCEAAEKMMRQSLRRRHPELSEAELEEHFGEWIQRQTTDHSYGRLSETWAARFRLRP